MTMRWIKIFMTLILLMSSAACSKNSGTTSDRVGDISYDISSEELAVGIKNTVYFAYNSPEVTDEYALLIEAQAEYLNRHDSQRIIIEGYCDERGTREYNVALGERRAHAVKKKLIYYGVEASRITVVSYGKDKPNPNYPRRSPEDDDFNEYLRYNRRAVVILG